MKKYIFVAIFSALLVLWIAFIWSNSMKPADKSLEISSGVTDRLNVVVNEIADAVSKPATTPVTTTPATSPPEVTTDSATTTPATTEAATTEPATTEPVTTEPVLKERVVRKGAHFFEYMILGVLAAIDAVCLVRAISRRSALGITALTLSTMLLSFGVALIDEFVIQAKTVGRGPSWRDVGIDSAGALTGIAVCVVISLLAYCFAVIRKKNLSLQE